MMRLILWPQLITLNSSVRHEWGAECFSRDAKYIAYASNEADPSNMLIYIKKMANEREKQEDDIEPFCITDKPGWYTPGYWSPDSKFMNCSQLVTLTDYSVWLLNIEENKMLPLTPAREKSRFIVGPWSHDKKGFYMLSDLKREYTGLVFYDIGKSNLEWILTPEHDIETFDLSIDGKVFAWTENIEGYSKLYIKNLKSGDVKEIRNTLLGNGVIEDLRLSQPNGNRIGIMMTTPTSPSDIYIIDLNEFNNDDEDYYHYSKYTVKKLTHSLVGNIPQNVLINPELIRYNSFDGLEISAYLYKPHVINSNLNRNADKIFNGPDKGSRKLCGAILSIHGGPTAQERPLYDYAGFYQYLANNGIAVIAPNYRGSTGYGKSFEKKIYHDWGGSELKDLEYAVKWLISQDWLDKNRIGVFGASFGGFATLSCITRLPEYNWKAAIDIVGPSNLVTFAKAVPEHWKRFMGELVGDPEKEEEFLKQRSPISHIDNIRSDGTNLLIIQGANDPRVVRNESDQIVERLQSKNMNVEYIVFDDEGHGFTKYSNLVKALKKSAEFLLNALSPQSS